MAGSQAPYIHIILSYIMSITWCITQPLVSNTTAHYQSAVSMISFTQTWIAQWSDTVPKRNVQLLVGIHLTWQQVLLAYQMSGHQMMEDEQELHWGFEGVLSNLSKRLSPCQWNYFLSKSTRLSHHSALPNWHHKPLCPHYSNNRSPQIPYTIILKLKISAGEQLGPPWICILCWFHASAKNWSCWLLEDKNK